MTRGRGVARVTALAVVAALGLTACGVPLDDTARPVAGYRAPKPPSTGPFPSETGTRVVVWYVEGDALVSTTVTGPVPVTPEGLLSELAVSPADAQLRTLVVDPQGGAPLASVAPSAPVVSPSANSSVAAVTVQLSDTFSKLAPADQVLLIGQIVLTLTESDNTPILFTDATGATVAVPLPDGRLEAAPVTRNDYLSLTAPGPSPTPTR